MHKMKANAKLELRLVWRIFTLYIVEHRYLVLVFFLN